MNREAVSALGTIIGGVAVFATLVYLAVQVRQNTAAINAQSRQTVLAAAQTEIFIRIQHPDLDIAMVQDDVPSIEEQVKINSWLAGTLRAREFSWLQYNQGFIRDEPVSVDFYRAQACWAKR